MAQTVIWTGADAIGNINTNWSDANNWTGGVPGAAASIYFFDFGASGVQGSVDNVVSASIAISSLQYGNTNGFHTTQINSGVTLMVSNKAAANLIFAGTGTDNGVNQTSYSMIEGSGSFVVTDTNTGSIFAVQQGSATNGNHMATLDLSGLANFNLKAGRLAAGAANSGSSGADNRLSGTLYLAATNNIRVNGATPALDVGDASSNGGNPCSVYLGQTNSVFADSITIGSSKSTGILAFNPALISGNPNLTLGGNTNSRVTTLAIGNFSAQTTSGSTTVGNMNLGGGTVNAQVDTCFVGEGQTGNGSGPATGTLSLGAGLFNVNTLNVGYVSVNTAAGNVTGTVNVTNGTLVVNGALVLGYDPGAPATATGALNITNGAVLADNIAAGGGIGKISMSGGLLVVSNTAGSPAAPLNSLTVTSGATLQFQVDNSLTNAAVSHLSSDNSGVINISALPVVLDYPSRFPLIYCPAGGASGVAFSAGVLPGTYRGYISNDNSSMVWLVITNGPPLPKTDQWGGGVNNNWDTSTLNWTNNGTAVAYAENDFVLFNDLAQTGTAHLAGSSPHTPYSWVVTNNVLNYTFSGTNSVGGTVGLVKSGGATLTLADGGDNFSGGITVNGGTLILDEASGAISGGLNIAGGATTQIGNNDANGGLPSGAIVNNGALILSQSTTNRVPASISGNGSVTQRGTGESILSGANTYTGNTVVLLGTLALSGSGTISSSASVIVSNATFDISNLSGPTTLNNLNLTNAVITMGANTVNVSSLNVGGSGNTINIADLPGILFYPTNFTLIQSASDLSGYNFSLGALPAGNPAYAATLAGTGNSVVLMLTTGAVAGVQATVNFSPTNSGLVLNPAFCGLSYEKSQLTGNLFVGTDTSLANMFAQIAPAVLRIGGNSVDTTCWGGVSNKTPITAAEVDAFASFVKALPSNWRVIYGINMSVNNPTNCAAEAAYVANALGPGLLGFEIGNECDLYHENGIRSTNYNYSQFLSEWRALAAAITNTVPGWAITNGGDGWTLTGPASAGNTQGYTVPFAADEAGAISLVTQHYYRANGQSPSSTLQLLLQPDTSLPGEVSNIVAAATSADLPLGFRMDECGSFYNGGAPNVSDAYGTALWALDYLFTLALNGCQGMNFHGGGNGPGYTPIADNGANVVEARPEFYGLKIFSLVSQGRVIPATVSLASNINFTAYGVRRSDSGITAVLNNKDTNNFVRVTLNLGADVAAAQWMELTGPSLDSTNGYTLGGAPINPDGSWTGEFQSIAVANGQLTVFVPPISAILVDSIVPPVNLTFNLAGNQLNLIWPSNYTGWLLQSNAVGLTATAAWFTVPGSANTNYIPITISPDRMNVFYRMRSP